ncbi:MULTISPECIES: hypothetical protein [Kitasatospora]|uniref:L,D-transpeptidase n=1 Tax=Kitasatospora cathayae TaxID=3004092 RepID=A0ABY7QHU9_9ACTN|nr:hypothetical protein [Kitasatospora sp. HUAS 3-15]WBP91719.1 hypothetical protein O1G21_23045 [Kitasatospora sp. HUAS 3-15]
MGPGVVVTGLTLGALAVVSLLAFQANGAQDRAGSARPTVASTSTGPAASATPSASATPTVPPLPTSSGSGTRVVYSAGSHFVWLVDPKKNPQVTAAFPVTPGTVEPTPGSYSVYSRTTSGTGTDGRKIEHVVRFAQQNGVVFGFGAALDDTTPTAEPKTKTGGIRSGRAEGQLLWDFASNGTKVVVVA